MFAVSCSPQLAGCLEGPVLCPRTAASLAELSCGYRGGAASSAIPIHFLKQGVKSAAAKENGCWMLADAVAVVRGAFCRSGRRLVLPGSLVCCAPA